MKTEDKDNENLCKKCGHNRFDHHPDPAVGCVTFVPDKTSGTNATTSCGCTEFSSK